MSNFDGLVRIEIDIHELIVDCNNPDGESPNANAIIHQVQDATVEDAVADSNWTPVKGGKVEVDDEIADDEVLAAANLDICQNSNWQEVLISITDFDYSVTLLMADDGTCTNPDDPGCVTAEVYTFTNCHFSDNPPPEGESVVCDGPNYYDTFDWKKQI
jgi:hypothetical protein